MKEETPEQRAKRLTRKKLYNKKHEKDRMLYRENHREEARHKSKIYHRKNAKIINEHGKIWRKLNKDKILGYYKKYIKTHKEERLRTVKNWKDKNREKILIYRKKYYNEKYSGSMWRITNLLRGRINSAIKKGFKSAHTLELLGCSVDFLKNHLQQTAIDNGYKDFNINNYNGHKFNIDHIIPCSKFDLTKSEEQRKCFNWSNLQILNASDNDSKGNKVLNKLPSEVVSS
jgi:hypothetical protein